MLVGITAPNKIQEMTAVVSGGMEGIAHGSLRADGNHRVPNVDAHSDGDFKFNLGNFENEWNDNNSLLVFRYFNDFDRPLCAGGRFFIQALLPSAEHPTDLIEPENESAVAFVANHFLFPRELQEKTEQIGRGDSSRYEGEFFKRIISETGLKKRLEKTQENIVNPRADRVAVDALQVYYAFMPQAVTLLRFYKNQRSISLGGGLNSMYVHAYLRLYHLDGKSIAHLGTIFAWEEKEEGRHRFSIASRGRTQKHPRLSQEQDVCARRIFSFQYFRPQAAQYPQSKCARPRDAPLDL